VGRFMDGSYIPMVYKGGRLIRSQNKHIGQVDLTRAIESSSNPYFSILAGDFLEDPQQLNDVAKSLSFGSKTGIDLPGETSGQLPRDIGVNKSGLYAYAIGQHTLLVSPLQTAVMLSAFTNGGYVLKPKILNTSRGKMPSKGDNPIYVRENYSYKADLSLVGIRSFPIVEKEKIVLPDGIKSILLEGMKRVVDHHNNIRNYYNYPHVMDDYRKVKNSLCGKTSTSEVVERVDLKLWPNRYNHIWFGGVSYPENSESWLSYNAEGKPELVVVVYLRFGDYGKEAMPIAGQIVKKWREIKEKHQEKM
jgi:cell division protein FtsI/penicillin-binding protein 2